MTFQYIAKSYSDGSEQRGTIEAADRNSAIAAIRANGLMPTALGQVLDKKDKDKESSKSIKHNYFKNFLKSIAHTIDSFAERL